MLDYTRALQQQFETVPNCTRQQREIERLHRKLVRTLDRDERRKLLRLTDLELQLQDEIAVANFLSGFKLAWGIAKELGTPYSFAADEEERASELAEREVGIHGEA